jgi:hypothetical protein
MDPSPRLRAPGPGGRSGRLVRLQLRSPRALHRVLSGLCLRRADRPVCRPRAWNPLPEGRVRRSRPALRGMGRVVRAPPPRMVPLRPLVSAARRGPGRRPAARHVGPRDCRIHPRDHDSSGGAAVRQGSAVGGRAAGEQLRLPVVPGGHRTSRPRNCRTQLDRRGGRHRSRRAAHGVPSAHPGWADGPQVKAFLLAAVLLLAGLCEWTAVRRRGAPGVGAAGTVTP